MQRDLPVSDGFDARLPVRTPQKGSLSGLRARVKVLDPMTSIGPSMEAELVRATDSDCSFECRAGSYPVQSVQVLTPKGVLFGKAWFSVQTETGFEPRWPCSRHARQKLLTRPEGRQRTHQRPLAAKVPVEATIAAARLSVSRVFDGKRISKVNHVGNW